MSQTAEKTTMNCSLHENSGKLVCLPASEIRTGPFTTFAARRFITLKIESETKHITWFGLKLDMNFLHPGYTIDRLTPSDTAQKPANGLLQFSSNAFKRPEQFTSETDSWKTIYNTRVRAKPPTRKVPVHTRNRRLQTQRKWICDHPELYFLDLYKHKMKLEALLACIFEEIGI